MHFILINRSNLKESLSFTTAYDVAVFLLGRRISNWIIIKDSGISPKIVSLDSADVTEIEKACEKA